MNRDLAALIRFLVVGMLAGHGLAAAMPIRFLPWNAEVGTIKLGLLKGESITALSGLHHLKRSKAFDGVPGENGLLQLALMDRKDASGKPMVVSFKISPGNSLPLVLILPDPDQPSGIKPFVIEDSPTNFAWGSVRYFNATPNELIVRHDETVMALKEWTPTDLKPTGGGRNLPVQMVVRNQRDKLLYSAIWVHDPNVRKLAFIVKGSGGDDSEVDVKIIPEDRRSAVVEVAPKPQ